MAPLYFSLTMPHLTQVQSSLTSVQLQPTTLLTISLPLHHILSLPLLHLLVLLHHLLQVPPPPSCRPTPASGLTSSQPSQLTSSFLRQSPC